MKMLAGCSTLTDNRQLMYISSHRKNTLNLGGPTYIGRHRDTHRRRTGRTTPELRKNGAGQLGLERALNEESSDRGRRDKMRRDAANYKTFSGMTGPSASVGEVRLEPRRRLLLRAEVLALDSVTPPVAMNSSLGGFRRRRSSGRGFGRRPGAPLCALEGKGWRGHQGEEDSGEKRCRDPLTAAKKTPTRLNSRSRAHEYEMLRKIGQEGIDELI